MTCTACNKFTTRMNEVMVLHQVDCPQLPEEKREYRRAIASLMFGPNLDTALAVVRNRS